MDVAYLTPTNSDICVVFCYYNPSNQAVILENTLALESKLKAANIPYFTAELVRDNSESKLLNPTVLVKANSTLLYKESLWNLVEKKIPNSFTKICFMDANLAYTRADWLDCLSLILNFYTVVQPFNEIIMLDNSGNTVNSMEAAAKTMNPLDSQGCSWAVNRDFFRKIGGFPNKSVVNSSLFFKALTAPLDTLGVPILEDDFSSYSRNLIAADCKLKYLNSPVNSVFNGVETDYSELLSAIKSVSVNWESLFTLNSDGLWELNDAALNSAVNLTKVIVVPEAPVVPVVNVVAVEQIPIVAPVVAKVAPVVAKVVPVVAKVVPVAPVASFNMPPKEQMFKLPAAVKNNVDRAAAAALISNFKKR